MRINKLSLVAMTLMCCFGIVSAQQTASQKYLIAIERIWDRAPHNAFTDLVEFRGKLYCTFREGSGHVPGKSGTNGVIRVIVSDDAQNWRSVALLQEAGVDLRDSKLSVTPDGRLMVLMGGSVYEGEKLVRYNSRVSFSDRAGRSFSMPKSVVLDETIRTGKDWLWRVTWHRSIGYGVVYQSGAEAQQTMAHLVSTRDGAHYQHLTKFDISGSPNETTLRVRPDGEMIALVRREAESKKGYLGTSRPPYKTWSWQELNVRLGGPEFSVLANGKMITVTRGYVGEKSPNTYVAWMMKDGTLNPIITLPSGGDTSYAGMVMRGDKLLVSYYSSHEGKAAIYLATLNLSALLSE